MLSPREPLTTSQCFALHQRQEFHFPLSLYGKSESGWIDSELFLAWLRKIFLKYSVPQRPVVLFVDGHKTHMTLDVIDLCQENKVILFCLPPHTTHALQPLDVAVFKSLKDKFGKAVCTLSFSNLTLSFPSKILHRYSSTFLSKHFLSPT